MANMFYNCYSLISLKIEELNLSKLEKTDNMFYRCTSLQYLNLTNFYSNITSSNGMFRDCNSNLIYCIDDTKEYKFLFDLNNFRKSCSDMCTKYFSKKYIIENKTCIDTCANEIIYKYDFNNICLENCPNNTILANDNITCNSIEDNKNNKNIIIIISIVGGVIILVSIIVIFVIIYRKRAIKNNNNQETLLEHNRREQNRTTNVRTTRELVNINTRENEKIKIIFNFNQERTEIFKSRKTSLKNLISSYIKRKHFQNKQMIIFMFDGKSISYDEAVNDDRKIGVLFPGDIKEKEILVCDWTSRATQSP